MDMTRSTFLKTLSLAAAGCALPGGLSLAADIQTQTPPAELELLEAVRSGDTQRVEALLAKEPGLIDRALPGGGTALHAAVRAGQGAMVSFLVGKGADSNALSTDPPGFTPLRWAAEHADLATAELMVDAMVVNGADPNARQADGVSPLHAAAAAGNIEVIQALIYDGADPEARTPDGKTALQLAADREAADLLRRHRDLPRDHSTSRFAYTATGAPFVRQDTSSPLPIALIHEYVAVSHGSIARVRELLASHPGLLLTRARWDEMAVEAAAHVGNREIVEFQLERGAPLSLCTAAMMGMLDRVGALLREDPKRVRETGAHNIPLTWFPVVGGGHLEVMKALLQAGTDVNSHKRGQAALHLAARTGQLEMASLLLDRGADVNARAKTAQGVLTPLAMATQASKEEMVEMLRRRGGEG
ncbi:MAG TPA: ankyrin repeat domain-containing protein [Thermoanaerobaculia bacterium]|nr:ankyrin repeat domain-containing protein [Thermoanaerobaculia bacterium]